MIARRSLLLAALAALPACVTARGPAPFYGVWRAESGATIAFIPDGMVEQRDARGYPPPPPIHTTWQLAWSMRGDDELNLFYDGYPSRRVAIARLAGRNRLEVEYSPTNIHVFERVQR